MAIVHREGNPPFTLLSLVSLPSIPLAPLSSPPSFSPFPLTIPLSSPPSRSIALLPSLTQSLSSPRSPPSVSLFFPRLSLSFPSPPNNVILTSACDQGAFQQPPIWASMDVYRSYYYSFSGETKQGDDASERVEVYLTSESPKTQDLPEIGSFFHDLKITPSDSQSGVGEEQEGGGMKVTGCRHPCGEDVYLPSFTFYFPRPLFSIEMTVVGPSKDYSIHSRLERIKHQ